MEMRKLNLSENDTNKSSLEKLFEKNIWHADELGIKPHASHSAFKLNFKRIEPHWLREIVKKFVAFQAATKTFNTCLSYIVGLIRFGKFITQYHMNLQPNQINRAVMVEYVGYVNRLPISVSSKYLALIHLRTLIEIAAQEEWLPFPRMRIIFNTDFPKGMSAVPRFIPESVMDQLNQHLNELRPLDQRLISILQETGRRISEICTLPFDCLRIDEDNSYFLEIADRKTKKIYLIPITNHCSDAIKDQQKYLQSINKHNCGYLFIARSNCHPPHVRAPYVNHILNKLAREKNICDTNNKIWHFQAHQFRHTVGTRMINAGVSQHIVQRYLGHETPEMTSRYAHIHDRTLKEAFVKFQGNLVNIQGQIISNIAAKNAEEQWLKHNIMAQALPNGYCGLPAKQMRCPHANACLTCTHFRTDESFLPQHTHQLNEANKILETAKKHGWQRQIEMNQEVKINLENIIATLKVNRHEHT